MNRSERQRIICSTFVLSTGQICSFGPVRPIGYFHLGIPLSGAMDRFALRAANMLVGNEEGFACLEAVFIGPEIEFTKAATVAVTGATLPIKVDGEVQEAWASFVVKAGQTLSFDFLQAGARIYIAVSGGITTPEALGSRSTYSIGALGGVDGRAIQVGDDLPTGDAEGPGAGRVVSEILRRKPGTPASLRVLPGLYWHRLTDAAGAEFFEDNWTVAPEADRMGYRFKGGRPLEFVDGLVPAKVHFRTNFIFHSTVDDSEYVP